MNTYTKRKWESIKKNGELMTDPEILIDLNNITKERDTLLKENAEYKKNIEYHKSKITQHWMVAAYERMQAGDGEEDTLLDFGYVPASENKELREGNKILSGYIHGIARKYPCDKTQHNQYMDGCFSCDAQSTLKDYLLLSSNTPVDKSTDNVSKEWSDWYPYKEPLDFDIPKDLFDFRKENKIQEYRIKLDGVKIVKYLHLDGVCFIVDKLHSWVLQKDTIGHDPHNKIIIIKVDPSTINQKE